MNNFFDVVDNVVFENGGTATLFVKAGDEYVRVATNVRKDDGSRATGTMLTYGDPQHQIRQVLSRCCGHWIAISLNSRSFCCRQHPPHVTPI
jgi:hypothetical protein